jgi:RNA polymerase sigma factor (sigma-70 family)
MNIVTISESFVTNDLPSWANFVLVLGHSKMSSRKKQKQILEIMTAYEFNQELLSIEDSLARFAYSLTSNKDKAKDLLQETYVKAIIYRDKFEEYSNLKAWTYTIMKNTFINNYRKSKREKTSVDDSKDLYQLNSNKESQLMQPESEYSLQELTKAVNSLDNDFRAPFILHTQGFKYKEIADELNMKIGTVKSRIFFTRKKLMEILKDYN